MNKNNSTNKTKTKDALRLAPPFFVETKHFYTNVNSHFDDDVLQYTAT